MIGVQDSRSLSFFPGHEVVFDLFPQEVDAQIKGMGSPGFTLAADFGDLICSCSDVGMTAVGLVFVQIVVFPGIRVLPRRMAPPDDVDLFERMRKINLLSLGSLGWFGSTWIEVGAPTEDTRRWLES